MVGKYKVTVERVNEIMRPSRHRKLKHIYLKKLKKKKL